MLPNYIVEKLQKIHISQVDIHHIGYLNVFARLRLLFPSISYQVLKDLYLYCHPTTTNLPQDILKLLITEYRNLPPSYAEIDHATQKKYMNIAYNQAEYALSLQEVPVGAVIVKDDKIIASAHNKTNCNNDIMAHAEILAMQIASKRIDSPHRLSDCDLYVTLEPCVMCAGAIIENRIKRVFFGCYRSNNIGAVSLGLFTKKQYNSHCQVIYYEDIRCSKIMTESFVELRKIKSHTDRNQE